jgi:NADPH2:quinone reductase
MIERSRAIVISEYGGPDVLKLADVAVALPGEGEILVRQLAAGVNYHDVYVRAGIHNYLSLPGIPGAEAVGIIEMVGPGVSDFAVGDQVGFVGRVYGGYATRRVLPASKAIRLPAWLSPVDGAALLLKGITAQTLFSESYMLKRGDTILVHAAAGALGQLLVQWATARGATVIGTAGSSEKVTRAREAGCTQVINYTVCDFVDEVLRITGGHGVDAVFDGVGEGTMRGSIQCAKVRGTVVTYGQASGPVPPISVAEMSQRSLTVTRPAVFHYIEDQKERQDRMEAVLAALKSKQISISGLTVLPLASAPEAHRLLENRASSGPIVLDLREA